MDKFLIKNPKTNVPLMSMNDNTFLPEGTTEAAKLAQRTMLKKMTFESDSDEENIIANVLKKPKSFYQKVEDNNEVMTTPKKVSLKRKSISLSLKKSPAKEDTETSSQIDDGIPLAQSTMIDHQSQRMENYKVSSSQILGKLSDDEILQSEKLYHTDDELEFSKSIVERNTSKSEHEHSGSIGDEKDLSRINKFISEDIKLFTKKLPKKRNHSHGSSLDSTYVINKRGGNISEDDDIESSQLKFSPDRSINFDKGKQTNPEQTSNSLKKKDIKNSPRKNSLKLNDSNSDSDIKVKKASQKYDNTQKYVSKSHKENSSTNFSENDSDSDKETQKSILKTNTTQKSDTITSKNESSLQKNEYFSDNGFTNKVVSKISKTTPNRRKSVHFSDSDSDSNEDIQKSIQTINNSQIWTPQTMKTKQSPQKDLYFSDNNSEVVKQIIKKVDYIQEDRKVSSESESDTDKLHDENDIDNVTENINKYNPNQSYSESDSEKAQQLIQKVSKPLKNISKFGKRNSQRNEHFSNSDSDNEQLVQNNQKSSNILKSNSYEQKRQTSKLRKSWDSEKPSEDVSNEFLSDEKSQPNGNQNIQKSINKSNISRIYDKLKTICDRDDDEEGMESHFSDSLTVITNIDEFKAQNQKFNEILYKSKLNVDDINSDDEIFLIQCPKLLDPKSLEGQYIDFDKNSTINIENTKFDANVIYQGKQNKICLIGSSASSDCPKLTCLNVNGTLTLSEHLGQQTTEQNRLSKKHHSSVVKVINDKVEFPTKLKIRHPLFGIEFSKHVHLSSEIMEKLNEAKKIKQKILRKAEKRKHRKLSIKTNEEEFCNDDNNGTRYFEYSQFITNLSSTEGIGTRKRKNTDDNEKSSKKLKIYEEENNLTEQQTSSKRKRKRSETIEEFDTAAQPPPLKKRNEYEFNVPEIIRKKSKSLNFENDNDSVENSVDSGVQLNEDNFRKKKKKKHKHNHNIEAFDENVVNLENNSAIEVLNSSNQFRKKKKHRND